MKVGVVGLGTMGAGIAQLAVEAGLETVGREVTDELGDAARGRIEHFLTRKVEKGQIDSFDIWPAHADDRPRGVRGLRRS